MTNNPQSPRRRPETPPAPQSAPQPANKFNPLHAVLVFTAVAILTFGIAYTYNRLSRAAAKNRHVTPPEESSTFNPIPPNPIPANPGEPATLFSATPADPDAPPPVSLIVSAGALDDVAIALTSQLGVKFGSDPNPPAEKYTFNLHDVPFPQIQTALANHHILWDSAARVLKISDTIDTWRLSPPKSGIAVALSPLTVSGTSYAANLAISVDPRFEVLKARPPKFDPLTDDQSATWQVSAQPPVDINALGSWNTISFQRKLSLRRSSSSAPKPSSLPSLAGTISVVQALVSDTVTLESPVNNLNTPATTDPYDITLLNAGGRLTLSIHRAADSATVDATLPLNILIVDNTQTAWGISSNPPAAGQTKSVSIPTNFPALEKISRIAVRFPTKTRDLVIPFEFKAVPLP